MTDSYVYIIHEADWNSDQWLPGAPMPEGAAEQDPDMGFPAHKAFQAAVAELGARITGGQALQNTRHGGTVKPGDGDRKLEDAVYTDGPFTDTAEVITGFYMVETDDEDTARRIAALVPSGGHVEWRKVFPTGA
jgi:hypothetical protein